MVSLIEITEENYQAVCSLNVSEEQKGYVAPPTSVLARAYAKRHRNARALAIAKDENIIGVVMFFELFGEPACYTIEQFLIDHRFQNKGFGKRALQLVIDILALERKYEAIEVCVKKDAAQAITSLRCPPPLSVAKAVGADVRNKRRVKSPASLKRH